MLDVVVVEVELAEELVVLDVECCSTWCCWWMNVPLVDDVVDVVAVEARGRAYGTRGGCAAGCGAAGR